MNQRNGKLHFRTGLSTHVAFSTSGLLLIALLFAGFVWSYAPASTPPANAFVNSPAKGSTSEMNAAAGADSNQVPKASGVSETPHPAGPEPDMGQASYYGSEFEGARTASGERFDPEALTAAHPTLPFGTRLRVTNVRNGESVVVRVNDRGPFTGRRIVDLSYAAAREIGMIRRGVTRVMLEIVH